MARRPRKWEITRLDQLRALASPVREEIVARLSVLGPSSIGDVARALGRKPQALYPHFRKLVAVGLVERCGERPTARRPEALYRTPARDWYVVHDKRDARRRRALADHVGASLRRSERGLRAALESEDAATRGPKRDTLWMRRSVWLTPSELAELNRHIDAIAALGGAEPAPGARLQAVMVGLHPVELPEED